MRHDARRVAHPRNFQLVSASGHRQREESFEDVVHGQIGGSADKEAERFGICGRGRCQLPNNLDEGVRLSSPCATLATVDI